MLKSLKTTPRCSPGHRPKAPALSTPTSPLGLQVTFPGPLTLPCYTLLGAGFSVNGASFSLSAGTATGEAACRRPKSHGVKRHGHSGDALRLDLF